MRSRNIKPAFFKNETIGTLPYECRILFVGLWLMADKDGFLEYRPLRIKAEIFPYDNIDSGKITKLLEKLCNLDPRDRLIEIWVENGESKFIQIINFKKHQSPHKNEMSYKIKELLNDPEFSCNYTNFHGITGPFNERGMMNDESGKMNDEVMNDNTPLPPKGKDVELKDFLLKNIPDDLSFLKNNLLEFFKYRQQKPKSKRYQSEIGINGLFRDICNCIAVGHPPVECLNIAMERGWQTPSPDYFKPEMFTKLTNGTVQETKEQILKRHGLSA